MCLEDAKARDSQAAPEEAERLRVVSALCVPSQDGQGGTSQVGRGRDRGSHAEGGALLMWRCLERKRRSQGRKSRSEAPATRRCEGLDACSVP